MDKFKGFLEAIWRLIVALYDRSRPWVIATIKLTYRYLRMVSHRIGVFLLKQMKKHPGGSFSLGVHLIILLLLVGDLSALFREDVPVMRVVTLQMLPIVDKANVKAQDEQKKQPIKEQDKKEPKPTPPPVKKIEPKKPDPVESPISKISSKPKPPKAEVKKDPPKIVEKKQVKKPNKVPKIKHFSKPKRLNTPPKPKKVVKKPPPKPKPMKKAEPLLKNLDKTPPKSLNEDRKKMENTETFDASLPLGVTELMAIQAQFAECWNIPVGARDYRNVVVELQVDYKRNGALDGTPKMVGGTTNHPSFKIMADAAIRAVYTCNPLKNLPVDKYGTWKNNIWVFDPAAMGK